MSYIKCGVTTKIIPIYNNDQTDSFLEKSFDLKLYYKKESSYCLKPEILCNNLREFRKEVLSFTDGKGDSLDNCEAYCLNTNVDDLLNNKIVLIEDNERYYFSNNKYFKFDTDQVVILDDLVGLKLFLIPVYWDINRVKFENFIPVASFMSKLLRTSTNNVLKGASFFVVV